MVALETRLTKGAGAGGGSTGAGPATMPPRAAVLLSAFSDAATGRSYASPPLAIAAELCRAHTLQWEAEDESREAAADAPRLGAVKRRIDRMNATRSELIEQLDTWVSRHLGQDERAPLHTETLGSVIDRLSIAWVRAQKLRAHGSDARSELALRQLHELGLAYDTLLAELAAQRRRVPDWRLLKAYGRTG